MTVLSSHDIQRSIGYGRFGSSRGGEQLSVEPASMDLHLGENVVEFAQTAKRVIVDEEETYPNTHERTISKNGFTISPNQFILATTEEKVDLPPALVGLIHGRSSVGRLGLFVHNAGFIDPGFSGQVTLELFNAAPYPITLKRGMKICQLALHEVKTPPEADYSEENGNKYDGQEGPTPSRLYEDFE